MLKIMLYANMEGIYSSRDIEKACSRDRNYIWLLNGAKPPNYHEIARFRSKRLTECGEALFYQLVERLGERGEIRYGHLFVDGTKIEANANKYSFVWKKSTTKDEARLLEKLDKLMPELCERNKILAADAGALLIALEGRMSGPAARRRGKGKSPLQRDIETLGELLERKKRYAQYQEPMQGRSSFSKTGPDAAFLHMKEEHLGNSQLKPGCNVQLGVEGEYITGVSICMERNDQFASIPLLENMETHLGRTYADVTADAGYESEENYTYFEGKDRVCCIKPQNYERTKSRKYKSNMALRENMVYDAQANTYICRTPGTVQQHPEKQVGV